MRTFIAVLALLAGTVAAQPYPAKPVRVISGFPPGSGADITARVIGVKLYEATGQQFFVENRPGAGSNIAAEVAAKSAPDGYTLFIGTVANTINATLYPKLPFDFARDFAPVALTTAAPNVLVVHPSVPVKSVKELVALAKSRPGQLNFASAGTGTAPHLSGELFNAMAGVKMTHVPYKGSPPAVLDLVAGSVDVMFSPASTVLPHVKSGRLRALAVTTAARLPSLPEQPTVSESGVPGYECLAWYALFGPAKLPAAIVNLLHREVATISQGQEMRTRMMAEGLEPLGTTPKALDEFLGREIEKWTRLAKTAGLSAQ